VTDDEGLEALEGAFASSLRDVGDAVLDYRLNGHHPAVKALVNDYLDKFFTLLNDFPAWETELEELSE
jgi:hypothetical protein